MFKIISSVLILSACSICALGIKNNYKKQDAIIDDIIETVEYIKNQIFFFNTPSEVILKNSNGNIICALDITKENHGINECRKIDFLPEKEKKTVIDFFVSFGKTSREEQLKICDYTIGVLKEYRENRDENNGKKINGYSCLCMVFGMLFVILII